jgi:hypothetical protein
VSLQDSMNKLKKRASAHQLSKEKMGQNTLLTRLVIGVGQGLAGLGELAWLDELPGLLGRIRVGCLVVIWVLVRVAHDRLQRRGDGKSYLVILKDFYPCV